jgi:site-specific recombinase XerD
MDDLELAGDRLPVPVTAITRTLAAERADVAAGYPGLPPTVQEAILAGIPESTRDAYGRDWRRFTGWCAQSGHTPLPATGDTLATYETYLANAWISPRLAAYRTAQSAPRGMKPASIERNRAAIITIHNLSELQPPSTAKAVEVLRGYKARLAEARDPRARPRKARAVRIDQLKALTEAPARTELATLRDRALLLTARAFKGRRSEVVRLNIEDIAEHSLGLEISVYRPKKREFSEVAVRTQDAPQTIASLLAWITALAKAGRTTGPLFVSINKGGHLAPPSARDGGRLTPQAVNLILAKHWDAAGLPGKAASSHGIRGGGASDSRAAGHDSISIGRQGGWAPNSTALAGYMDDADKWSDDNALRGAAL